jgi:hypothetical protein
MAAWLTITGFGLDDWIYLHLLIQSLVITINYNISQSLFGRNLLPWLPRTRSILVFVLRLTSECESEYESHIMTDGQSASLSWNKAPLWHLRPSFYYCHTVAGLLMWRALSDERTGLSFIIAAGPRQRSHSWVRVQWDSWTYFTVSDLWLPFSSPPTTDRQS